MTLFLITLPVQGLFLIYIHIMNWTKLPFLFLFLFVVIFCVTVRSHNLSRIEVFVHQIPGTTLTRCGQGFDSVPLATGYRPRLVRHANTQFRYRFIGQHYACVVLRDGPSARGGR